MINRGNMLSLFAGLFLIVCVAAQAEEPIIVDVFSASDRGQSHFSFSHEATKLIIQESGIDATIRVVPFKRMLQDLAVGQSDMAIFYDSDRSRAVAIPVATTVIKPNIVIGRAGLDIRGTESLAGLLIGVNGGGRYDAAFDRLSNVAKYTTESYTHAIDLLAKGKIDGMIGGKFLIMNELRQVGKSIEEMGGYFEVSQRVQALHLSKKSQHQEKAPILKATIDRLRAEGRFVELLQLTAKGQTFAELMPGQPQTVPTIAQSHAGVGVWMIGVENKDWEPYYRWRQGRLYGFDPAVVQQVSQGIGVYVQFEPMPWARAIEDAKAGEIHGVLDMSQTSERAPFFHFSDTYLTIEENQIWVPADSPLESFPGSLEALASEGVSQFGVIRGIALQKDIEAMPNLSAILYDDWNTLLKSLADGRIEATKGYQTATIMTAKKNNTLPHIRALEPPFSYMKYYVGLSKAAVTSDQAAQFSQALESFKNSDQYDLLKQSYFQ